MQQIQCIAAESAEQGLFEEPAKEMWKHKKGRVVAAL
jgi:hypothetical protein